jgi:hypothetical protein
MYPIVGFVLMVLAFDEPPTPPLAAQCTATDASVICQAEAGPNWSFLYAYPAEIRAWPMLFVSFRRSASQARERFEALIAEARRNPQEHYSREEVYTIDASTPELLAMAVRQVQQAGGAGTTWSVGSLIWDRRGGRLINFEELFEEAEAGQALVNARFCPALREARDAALGGRHEDCPDLYFARLIAGADGRIARLHLGFDPIDGLDEGQFDVEVPVTTEIIAALRRPFRSAFVASEGAITTCHRASAGDPCR